ncbi:glycosyltransferase [Terriglobus saanensis]|uniref:Glycosyltransferase, MGT family n=1 Tax=Terriglobus saanensis (strain ATCC BAA-1853 / DSM 23119 / SP1PR4) TaxID=401053 RepID=E8V2E5_TERSS|nr:nucleotide disphospho-sugar-binding domain-containing protein [Terriglobus saanensis]ADV82363.1 glycosyltransferase, MGT family [Terriglobus saanensis SP1PR4]
MKIGFVSMPLSGHLNPMTALARKLQSRGHEIVFFGVPDVEPFARAAGLEFTPFAEKEYPVGSIAEKFSEVAHRHGLEVVDYSCNNLFPSLVEAGLTYLPAKLAETGVEAMVFDTICFYLEMIPMSMGIPYVHIWNILHVDFSGKTPACFVSFPYETTPEAISRNTAVLGAVGQLWAPMIEAAKPHAVKLGLEMNWDDPTSTISKLAIISQTPKEFDFPENPWPEQFVYAGPLHDDGGRESVEFPWDKLTGAPLIYASLGTLVNGLPQIYRNILDAVEKLPHVQLVLSIGKNLNVKELGSIPSNVIVVKTAPQIELLKSAALCITHAGLNTALESLGQGVPMVAIPVGYDQPGVAARIAYHGVGEFVEVADLTSEGLQGLIEKVLESPSYRKKALFFKKVIAKTQGLDVAADAIERVFGENRPTVTSGENVELSHA